MLQCIRCHGKNAFLNTLETPCVKSKRRRRGTYLERERQRQMLLKKLHLISIRAASPISSPYYSNLSDRREHSREKSNIPRPSTFNISSQDGRRAGRRAGGRTGKLNRKISREKHAGCVLHLQLSYSVMENWRKTVWCVLVLSSLAKRWKMSTRWMMAKKIMESERRLFFFPLSLYNSRLRVHLGGMTCICLQPTIKNDKDCTLLIVTAEVHFLTSPQRITLI